MTHALLLPAPVTFTSSSLILAGTRCWRNARDHGRPVQPALYRTFGSHRGGLLAPVFASLLTLYESYTSRPIRVGESHPTTLSTDEHRLLSLVVGSADMRSIISDAANNSLAGAMRIAVHSAQVMMRHALESVGNFPPLATSRYLPALIR